MLQVSSITINGVPTPGKNPLARFKALNRTKQVSIDSTMSEEDTELMGFEAAERYLPYQIQDIYSRDRKLQTYQTIVLENEYLRAEFLPEYGGRLYSLYHKELKRELLFCNPVIQPANLAILNAWISGGIEWNLGQLGHSFTTCEPLFCCAMKDKEGNDFLRMFEYERCHNLFWHLDFHLPKGSRVLTLYARIINDRETQTSLYWWTNTAVQETKDTRIFSCTDEVIYLNMENLCYGKGQLPYLPVMPDTDATYPLNFKYANEYFYLNPTDLSSPWEAAVYPGWMFYERSSAPLFYRKMFCWGNHQGGRHWKEHLSEKGRGDYIEIQAGLAKTQLHGLVMPAGETVDFVQCFGGIACENQQNNLPYMEEAKGIERRINQETDEQTIERLLTDCRQYAKEKPEKFLVYGSGFGALEELRRRRQGEAPVPLGFEFPADSMGEEQKTWKHLLEEGIFPEESIPASFMIQKEWRTILSQSKKSPSGLLHLAIMMIEDGECEEAVWCLTESLEGKKTGWAYYYLAYISRLQKKYGQAAEYYDKAVSLCKEAEAAAMYREYFTMLEELKQYEKLEQIYASLPEALKEEERIYLFHIFAGLALGHLEEVEKSFHRDYVYIRENETDLSDIWLSYHGKKHLEETGEEWTEKEIRAQYPVPYELDFRTCRE